MNYEEFRKRLASITPEEEETALRNFCLKHWGPDGLSMLEIARQMAADGLLMFYFEGDERVWHSSEFNPRPESKTEQANLAKGPIFEGMLLQRNPDGTVRPMEDER